MHQQGKLLPGHRRLRAGALHLPAQDVRRHHRFQRRDNLHRLQRRAPGRKNCSDLGRCAREELNIPSGERYELCRSVHAEANAIISAARRDMIGATLYLVGRRRPHHELLPDAMSCAMCKKLIINSGIRPL
jgi:hypothetical protein